MRACISTAPARAAHQRFLVEELLGVERRHAAGAGGGDRLAVDLVGDVAGGEHARHLVCGGDAVRPERIVDVAVVHLELALEEPVFGVWPMATNRPWIVDARACCRPASDCEAHAGDAGVVAEHFVDGVVPDQLDLAGLDLGEQLVLQDLLGAQLVAAVHEVDLARDVGQVQRFLDRGVAAADHRDVLVLKKKPSQVAQADTPRPMNFCFGLAGRGTWPWRRWR